MTGYTKLFNSIVGSTIWREDPATKVVWITLLALADRDGIVESSIPGLANYAGVSIPETEAALQKFMAPDVYSGSPENEGRRIEPVDGGWRLLNYDKYRLRMSPEDIGERDRIRKQRQREHQKLSAESGTKRDMPEMSADSDMHKADLDSKGKETAGTRSAFVLPDWVPVEAWNGFVEMRRQTRKPMTDRAKVLLLSKLERMRQSGHDAGTLLDQSTLSSWTSVYEPKTPAPCSASPIPMRRASTEMDRQLREC